MIRMTTEIPSHPIQWMERRERRKKVGMTALHYSAGWTEPLPIVCIKRDISVHGMHKLKWMDGSMDCIALH